MGRIEEFVKSLPRRHWVDGQDHTSGRVTIVVAVKNSVQKPNVRSELDRFLENVDVEVQISNKHARFEQLST